MLETLTPVLTDESVPPTAPLIEETLGVAYPAWLRLEEELGDAGLVLEWVYYRDGGWLCKALRGKKNLAWLAVWDDQATVTFYFSERHREGLTALEVPEQIRQQAATAQMIGRMLPLRLDIREPQDVDSALRILDFKKSAK